MVRDPGNAESDYRRLSVDVRVVDPVIAATAFQGVVHVSGSVARQDHDRRFNRGDPPDLGDRDGELSQQLEQERFELVVGPVDLVEKKYRTSRGTECPQKGSLDKEVVAEDIIDDGIGIARFRGTDPEQLLRIV